QGAERVGRTGGFTAAKDWVEGREDPGAGKLKAVDGVAYFFVDRRAEALDRGETGSEHFPRVSGSGDGGALFGFILASEFACGIEVPGGMGMCVDETRENAISAKVVHDRLRELGALGIDAGDFTVFDDDGGVAKGVAAPVKGSADPE